MRQASTSLPLTTYVRCMYSGYVSLSSGIALERAHPRTSSLMMRLGPCIGNLSTQERWVSSATLEANRASSRQSYANISVLTSPSQTVFPCLGLFLLYWNHGRPMIKRHCRFFVSNISQDVTILSNHGANPEKSPRPLPFFPCWNLISQFTASLIKNDP